MTSETSSVETLSDKHSVSPLIPARLQASPRRRALPLHPRAPHEKGSKQTARPGLKRQRIGRQLETTLLPFACQPRRSTIACPFGRPSANPPGSPRERARCERFLQGGKQKDIEITRSRARVPP
jgi:hypothetical protein